MADRKLSNELPSQEQNVLDWLVDRAQNELSDSELSAVSGGQDLANSLGFEGEDIKVTWSLSFGQA